MRMTSLLSRVLTGVMVCQPLLVLGANAGPAIQHQPLTCVPADGNTRVTAKATSADSVTSMKVYFRSNIASSEYFIEMRRDSDGSFWALLPKTAPATNAVAYRIVAKDSSGVVSATPLVTVSTSSSCAASARPEDARYVSNVVLGLTVPSQTGLPVGFGCAGIVGVITPTGDLKSNEDCRANTAWGGGEADTTKEEDKDRKRAGAWWTSDAFITGAVVGATALGAVIVNNSGSHSGTEPVSSARPTVATKSGKN